MLSRPHPPFRARPLKLEVAPRKVRGALSKAAKATGTLVTIRGKRRPLKTARALARGPLRVLGRRR